MAQEKLSPKLSAAIASQRAATIESVLIALERRVCALERSAAFWAQEDATDLGPPLPAGADLETAF